MRIRDIMRYVKTRVAGHNKSEMIFYHYNIALPDELW